MANPEHVEIAKQGAAAIREWREKTPDVRLDLGWAALIRVDINGADLHGADFHGTDLSRADLSRAELSQANLRGANLYEANLDGTMLDEANLSEAYLAGASLIGAHLTDADLSGAILSGAILSKANLSESTFRSALVGGTVFAGVDLSVAKELETVRHVGPSTVGVDTLVRSLGHIPDDFLRGCGFTPWQILEAKLFDPALTSEQFAEIQYKVFHERNDGPLCIGGVFISYSREDAKFVDKVYQRLQNEGASVWLDRHDMVAGSLQKQVSRAIRLNDVVLLVLSEVSVKSDWVENELDIARGKEKAEGRDVLCPVALDESWKAKLDHGASDRQLWRTLTHKNILDFSKWKTKAFDEQFSKLLRGMKIYYEPKKA